MFCKRRIRIAALHIVRRPYKSLGARFAVKCSRYRTRILGALHSARLRSTKCGSLWNDDELGL